MNGPAQFRKLLASPNAIGIIGAHNGLSARLGARAGYEGIWASGFEMSASFGVPDANIVTLTDSLTLIRQMVLASGVPVIADCDEGYGNAINVIHMVRQYEAAGVAAICIEDNVSPKRCSFYSGVKRELASVQEHAGKVRAAKDAQKNPDFAIIARTEALIAGWGMEEALKRGRAYADAGADMVLIHSKSKEPAEILAFAKAWDRKVPLVCVPTTYGGISVEELKQAGFKMIIHANHGMRSSIKAMKETFKLLRAEGKTGAVAKLVVPLDEVYDAVGVEEMKQQEAKYLPKDAEGTTAVILAAGFEKSLMPLIAERPRAMLDIRGKTILERQMQTFNDCSIREVAVVRGYRKAQVDLPNIRTYDNDQYETTSEAVSLFKAAAELKKRVVVAYGDVLFDHQVLEKLLRAPGDVTLVVDRHLAALPAELRTGRVRDLVIDDAPATPSSERFLPNTRPAKVSRIGTQLPVADARGEFIGLLMLSEKGCGHLREAWNRINERGAKAKVHEAADLSQAKLTDLIQEMITAGVEVNSVEVMKGWMEIDTFEDYQRAWASLPA